MYGPSIVYPLPATVHRTVVNASKDNLFFYHAATAPSGLRPPHYRGLTITLRLSSGRVISPTDRPIPYNTHKQHLQETHIHAPGGI